MHVHGEKYSRRVGRQRLSCLEPEITAQVLAEMASRQNKQPLPELSDKPGLQIPVNSLTGPSYQLEVTADPMLPSEPNAASLSETQSGSSLRGGNKQSAQLQIKLGESARAEGDWMDAA